MKTIIYILIFFISHSISAQSSWKKIESNTKLKLNSISFGTPQVGYIGADDTTLLKTIDGGITWNLMPLTGINLHMIQDIVHVDFLNANEGYIVINNSENLVSHNSATLFTSDGGITWSFKNMGMCGAIKNYYFDTANGYSIGSTCFGGRIVDKITNNFLVSTNYFTYAGGFLRGVDFVDTNYGIVAGDKGFVYRTTNSGKKWDTISRPFIQDIYDIRFVNDSMLFLVADSSNNSIFYSVDSGYTWQPHTPSLTFYYPKMKSLVVSVKDTVFAVGQTTTGNSGMIVWGEASSTNWTYFSNNSLGKGFNSIAMKDSVQPFAVGDSGIIYSYTKNITSLKENENKYKLTVFPNPTNSFITIESQKMEAIEIINIQGKIISNEDAVSSNSIKMSLGKCLPGLYLVKILYEDDSVRFKKIIKN